MNEATYTAWDDNSYPWPPPDGWYQATDGKWWPDGYGPQSEGQGTSESAASSTYAAAASTDDSSASSDDSTAVYGGTGTTAGTAAAGGAAAAAYSAANGGNGGTSVRTSSSEIFERMQREAAERSGRPWSGSESVSDASSLTDDGAGSVLDRASESAGSVLDKAEGTVGSASDGAGSITDRASSFLDRRSTDAAGAAAASTAALGAAAYTATNGGDDVGSVADAEATYEAGGYETSYTGTDVSAGQAAVDQADAGYSTDPAEALHTAQDATGYDQPIPGQELPVDYSAGSGDSYTDAAYTADSSVDGVAEAATAPPMGFDAPSEPGYDVHPGTPDLDPAASPVADAPDLTTPQGDGVVPDVSLSADVSSPAVAVPDSVPGDQVPWDDPNVDTAVNPVVRPDAAQDAAASIAADSPAPPTDIPQGQPKTNLDLFAPAAPPNAAPAANYDDGRFASYDNRPQVDRRPDPGPLLAPPVAQSRRGRGRGAIFGLIGLAALALAGLGGYFFYQQQQSDDETAAVSEASTDDAAPGSLTNPHDSTRAVQIEYTVEDVSQVWTIQASSASLTDLGTSTEIQADLNVANGNADGSAALADLVVSIVDADGEVLASGVSDCANTQAMSWGQSVPGGSSVSGPVCWVVPTESVDGALLGIESTKAQGRIHIQLPQ